MTDQDPRVVGRPIEESRAIALAGLRRWDLLASLWDELTDDEQAQIVADVQRMVAPRDV